MQVSSVLTLAFAILALTSVPSSAADKSTLGANPTLSISDSPAILLSNLPNQSIDFLNRLPASGPKFLSLKLDQELLCVDFASMPTGSPVGLRMIDRNNDSVLTLQPAATPTSQTLIWGGITRYDYFTNGVNASQLRISSTNGDLACCILQPALNAGCFQGVASGGATDEYFSDGFESAGAVGPNLLVLVIPDGNAPYVTAPGSEFGYAIRVINNGTQAASGVRIRDWIPKAASGVFSARFQGNSEWSCTGTTGGASCGAVPSPMPTNVMLDSVSLPVGASVTINVRRTMDVGSPNGQPFRVSAAAFVPPSPAAESVLSNNQSTATGSTGVLNYVSTPSLTFPATNLDTSSAPLNVVVTTPANGNVGSLQISSCSFGGAHPGNFDYGTVPSFPLLVAANSSVNLPVRFRPTVAGPRSATLTCQTNATAGSPQAFAVSLSGTGVNPNAQPEIDPIANQSSNEDAVDLVFQISVRDDDSVLAAADLSCSSSRPNLEDRSTCTFTGSEPNFMLMLSSAPDRNSNVPFGTETITVTVNDNAGAPNSIATRSFVFDVAPVNDAPVFTLSQSDIQVPAGTSGIVQVASFVTGIGPGPDTADDEQQQLLQQFPPTVAQGAPAGFFASAPVITYSGDPGVGTLAFLLGPNAVGVAEVSVRMKDNGGTANGGVDERIQTFTITALPPPPPIGPSLSYDPRAGTEAVPGTVGFTGGVTANGTITVTPTAGTADGTSTLSAFDLSGGDAAFFALTSGTTLTFPGQIASPQDVTLTCTAGATVRSALLRATETVQGSTPVQRYWGLECPAVVSGAD